MSISKVIFVANYAAFYPGNFISSMEALESELKQRRVDVIYVLPKDAPLDEWGGDFLECHNVRCVDFSDGSLSSCVAALVEPARTIIHTHFLGVREIYALKLRLKGGAYIVVHWHMRLESLGENRVKAIARKGFYRHVLKGCAVVAVSHAVHDDMVKLLGRGASVFLIENAISTKRLDEIVQDRSDEFDPSRDVVIFGTHYERKGVDIALRAVRESDHGLRLIVLTHDKRDVESRLDALDPAWNECCQVRHVVQDPQDVYRACMCFASPSRSEAFGYAVAEATYCGCRVVASDVPGQRDMKDVPGIRWVPPEDSAALREAFDACYEDAAACGNVRSSCMWDGKVFIEANYGIQKWVSGILDVYDKISGKGLPIL